MKPIWSNEMDVREATSPTPERVRQRLDDWRSRVDALYDSIEDVLVGTGFKTDRSGTHANTEKIPQRLGIHQPALNILRVVRPDGTNAATLTPKGLWVTGANGRVDLRIISVSGSNEIYLLLDTSEPLSQKPKWIRSRVSTPFDREVFDPEWLRAKLLERGP
jgi:hypothetical protein